MNKTLKSRLLKNEFTIGSWITLGNQDVAEIMAKANFDWLVVDLEHSSISIDMAANLIRVIELSGVTPLVRLTSNDSNQIKRVMDAGASGIVVPMINSSAEVVLANGRIVKEIKNNFTSNFILPPNNIIFHTFTSPEPPKHTSRSSLHGRHGPARVASTVQLVRRIRWMCPGATTDALHPARSTIASPGTWQRCAWFELGGPVQTGVDE